MSHTFIHPDRFHLNIQINRSKLLMGAHVQKAPIRPVETKLDLKSKISSIYDQGQLGSCTANAICQALKMTKKYPGFEPSRLYLYARERIMENQTYPLQDTGANPYDGLQQLCTGGICTELLYPYNISNAPNIPTSDCDTQALNYKINRFGILVPDGASGQQKVTSIEASIKSGIPVLIGILVYSSFETSTVSVTGTVPMPNIQRDTLLGGHEVLIVGYDRKLQRFILVNSWGSRWGNRGFFTLPYAYVSNPNLTFEFLSITQA